MHAYFCFVTSDDLRDKRHDFCDNDALIDKQQEQTPQTRHTIARALAPSLLGRLQEIGRRLAGGWMLRSGIELDDKLRLTLLLLLLVRNLLQRQQETQ